jgi:hypothetical protein
MKKKARFKKYVTINWRDHHSDDSWKTKSEIKKWAIEPRICTSRGQITYQDRQVIVLSASFDGQENFGENICIIKKNIVK